LSFRRALAILILGTGLASSLSATPARAYNPDATAAVLARVVDGLSPAARATIPPQLLAHELAELTEDADLDPERHEATRCGRMGEQGIEGGVVETFAQAECDLRTAWTMGDRRGAAHALVVLAQAACDLTDPFRTVTGDQDECEGARAHFTDLFDPASLDGVRVLERGEAHAATVTSLAHETAAVRGEVEAAHARGDERTLTRLRVERLSAAATQLAATVERAWHPVARADLRLSIGPNPLRGSATLRFELAHDAQVRLDLYDLAGRRVRSLALGRRGAGPQQVAVPASWTEGLAAGVYLARIDADGQHAEQRLTRLVD